MYPDLFSAAADTRGGRTHAPVFLGFMDGVWEQSGSKRMARLCPGEHCRLTPGSSHAPGIAATGATLDQRPGGAQGGEGHCH